MAGRRTNVIDVRELVRRFRMKQSVSEAARELGMNRKTAAKYRALAEQNGWLDLERTPELGVIDQVLKQLEVGKPGPGAKLEPWREVTTKLLESGLEIRALFQLLRENHGYDGSYSSLRRFVRGLEAAEPEAFLRVETPPGEEAQVDFGSAGSIRDSQGLMRPAWVFVMTLSWSRHCYVEAVWDQKVATWIELHVRAFEQLGGVPHKVVLDNLKAAIVKASLHEPEVQQAYRELAEHYGFLISPCRVATPRHKGKVESAVHYVARNALAGREFQSLGELNRHLGQWVEQTAGVRVHGTTREQPLTRFREVEQAALLALPPTRFEAAQWKQVKVNRDCHVVFDYSYYSAPYRLVGQRVMVRATARKVEIYANWEHVAVHERASQPGQWRTDSNHLPPAKLCGLVSGFEALLEQARQVGPSAAEVVSRLAADRPVDRARTARSVLRLGNRYGDSRLEQACSRALEYDDSTYRTIHEILKKGLEGVGVKDQLMVAEPKTARYARQASDWQRPGGATWN